MEAKTAGVQSHDDFETRTQFASVQISSNTKTYFCIQLSSFLYLLQIFFVKEEPPPHCWGGWWESIQCLMSNAYCPVITTMRSWKLLFSKWLNNKARTVMTEWVWMLRVLSITQIIVYPSQCKQQNTQRACSGLLWWASMTQHGVDHHHERANRANRCLVSWDWVTHHYCKRTGTRPIHPAGCPGSPLCPHRCLPPGGTWAGSHSFSLGCPGCPSHLSPGAADAEDEWL